jgi:hypothetical protein
MEKHDPTFVKRAQHYRMALNYVEKMATCLAATIDACDNKDLERAEQFSLLAVRHGILAEQYLTLANKEA